MKAAALCAALALMLAGCVTKGTTPPSTSAPTIDEKIATASKQLAQYCTLASIAITTGEAFATNPRVDQALELGRTAIARFCSAPPSNLNEAITVLAQTGVDIANAVAAAKKEGAAS